MRTIALVEDNEDNRILVHALLQERYRIRDFQDGDAALAGMRRDKPDLVLLDISLPGMDGTEVLVEMRQDAVLRDVPVIALTAYAAETDRERFLTAGFDDYVQKPIVHESVLLDAIARQLEGA